MPKMTKDQSAYLWGRLRAAEREQEIPYDHEATPPAEVVKAKAVIAKWEKDYEAKRERTNEAVQKRLAVAKEAYYGRDYAKALEAVKRFEAGK